MGQLKIISVIAFVVIANILFITMKYIVKKNGYDVRWRFRIQDYADFHNFIKTRHSNIKSIKYRILVYGHYVCIVLAAVVALF